MVAAQKRISEAFDNSSKVYVAFSGGKDSTVMTHLVAEEAKRRNRRFGLMFIDLEAQYTTTIDHVKEMFRLYRQQIKPYWLCLPLNLRNAVSVYQPQWMCWDSSQENLWVRQPPSKKNLQHWGLPFSKGMEFEQFVLNFGEFYSHGEPTTCFVGIRTDESLGRFFSVVDSEKTKVTENVTNVYPIYDWKVEDIWTYHSQFSKPYNKLYDLMYKAGVPLNRMRICQPFGDEQKNGLWMYRILEPETWAKVVKRVAGANTGAMYAHKNGTASGRNIILPKGHNWKSFCLTLVASMPELSRRHYEAKVNYYCKLWESRCYSEGIPDEAPVELEKKANVPSYRRVCQAILKNDYWFKSLGMSQGNQINAED